MIEVTVRNVRKGSTKLAQMGSPSVYLLARHLNLLGAKEGLRPGQHGYEAEADQLRASIAEMLGVVYPETTDE